MSKPKIMYMNTAAANVMLDIETKNLKITVGEFYVPSENPYVVRFINKLDNSVSFSIPSNKLLGREIITAITNEIPKIVGDEIRDEMIQNILNLFM